MGSVSCYFGGTRLTATYTPGGTDKDLVRLIIRDTDMTSPSFQDEEIQALLTIALGNDPRWAAAEALDTLASQIAATTQAVKVLDLYTRGDLVGAELRARANKLREQYEQDPEAFDYAEMPDGDMAQRERLFNEFLRHLT